MNNIGFSPMTLSGLEENMLYDYDQIQAIANSHCLGEVFFEDRVAKNTGRVMRIGKVQDGDKLVLFCKKSSFDNGFKLCNEFANLSTVGL